MSHSLKISAARPGCVIFVVDRSEAMARRTADHEHGLAPALAYAVNNAIDELVRSCVRAANEPPLDCLRIGLIGYGASAEGTGAVVGSAFEADLAGGPLVSVLDVWKGGRRAERSRQSSPRARRGGAPRARNVWLEARAGYGAPMAEALEAVQRVAAIWTAEHPRSHPPVVVHVSGSEDDHRPSGGADVGEWARRLTGLRTEDGAALFFNVLLAPGDDEHRFAPDSMALGQPWGVRLFEMSSELPPLMLLRSAHEGHPLRPGARGLLYGASAGELADFLDIVTSTLRRVEKPGPPGDRAHDVDIAEIADVEMADVEIADDRVADGFVGRGDVGDDEQPTAPIAQGEAFGARQPATGPDRRSNEPVGAAFGCALVGFALAVAVVGAVAGLAAIVAGRAEQARTGERTPSSSVLRNPTLAIGLGAFDIVAALSWAILYLTIITKA